MSDSKQQDTENVSPPEWPENGGDWSAEEGVDTGGLLQEMAEEDETIDLYNEETFGMDMEEAGGGPTNSLLQFKPPPPPPLPPASPPLASRSPSPPRPQHPPGLQGRSWNQPGWRGWNQPGWRGWSQPGGRGRVQMFEDPAVMRTVEGRPSLKSLDSAILDCGTTSRWDALDPDAWMLPSYRSPRRTPGLILQDNAIVCVIDRGLQAPYLLPSTRGRRGSPRGPFGLRCPSQMSPMMHGSPIITRRPLSPQQYSNQTVDFLSPASRPCPSTPKMVQLRFGANSPRPSPFYSPSSNPLQRFRFPGPVTQLHPQHRRLLSQRQQRSQRKADGWDPYCHLMSPKEKDWIIRLQMIQLQSENPHLDDYYYQEYYRRMEAKLAEEELGLRGSKRDPPKLTTPYVTKADSYMPVLHIEGSLGQVAVSTCYSPRRAINAVQAHSPSEEVAPAQEHKDISQQRLEVLKKIEKLFVVMLDVEEAQRLKSVVLGEAEERRLVEKTQRKVEQLYSQLQHPDALEAGEEFLPVLLVSKGKRLLARLLPFLSHDAALHVLRVVTAHLPVLMSRDSDEALPVLYPAFRSVIGGLTFSQLIGVLRNLTSSSKNSESLTLACRNKFGLSLLYALLSQGERLLSSDLPLEPSLGDFETWTDTVFQVAWQLSQSALVEPLLLPSNLLTLFCRYLDKRTVHQLKSNIESATGVMALAS
ncbi:protein PAT1 homolog 2 isoform X1 [Osmerus eperlanus]|uniref:protein PAT1 homolog 2 isoform X1 n=1 Tax=Osmerus eperlanus TaxID=29151 RepID=UPI002E132419